MARPVERWLGTFMCTQYTDTFEAYGYKTLQSVSTLRGSKLEMETWMVIAVAVVFGS